MTWRDANPTAAQIHARQRRAAAEALGGAPAAPAHAGASLDLAALRTAYNALTIEIRSGGVVRKIDQRLVELGAALEHAVERQKLRDRWRHKRRKAPDASDRGF